MSALQLKTATRRKTKLRLSIAAPTGFGKTYSALLLAYGMTQDWEKVAVIDTENGSADLYAHLGPYQTITLEPPFSPARYIEAIKICEQAGIEVLILDSITHVWHGQGGILEYKDSLGGRYQDWAKATPLYQQWLNAILHSSCHVICTMRKKQAYSMVTENNRTKVEKAGLEDQIREGFDYEMTIAFDIINDSNMVKVSKDRTQLFTGKPEFKITPNTGEMIRDWCELGIVQNVAPVLENSGLAVSGNKVSLPEGEEAQPISAEEGKRMTDEAIKYLANCNSEDEIAVMEDGYTFPLKQVKRYREAKAERIQQLQPATA
jgi:hypothetical protein